MRRFPPLLHVRICAFSFPRSDRRRTISCPQRSQRYKRLHLRRRCRRGKLVGQDARTLRHLRHRPMAGCSHRTCATSTHSLPPFTKRYTYTVAAICAISAVPGPLFRHRRDVGLSGASLGVHFPVLCVRTIFTSGLTAPQTISSETQGWLSAFRYGAFHTLLTSLTPALPSTPYPLRARLRVLRAQETAQKRLVLAAAALPVLQVPLHAFSLVVPYLVALLEAFSPKAEEIDMRTTRETSVRTEAGEACATSTADGSNALFRQGRGGACPQRKGRRRRPYILETPTTSTGLSAPTDTPPSIEEVRGQPSRLVAAEAAVENRPTVLEDAEASAQAETSETEASEAAKHAAAWVSVFDLCAARLGPSLAAEVLLSSVLMTLEG